MGMDKLAALIEKKRKARQESAAAAEAATKRKKQEAETATLATQTSVQEKSSSAPDSGDAKDGASQSCAPSEPKLPPAETKRRLRLLGQPITMFGEDDVAREVRLKLAEENMQVEDEHAGGQLNANWQLQKERKEKARLDKLRAVQPAGLDPVVTASPVVAAPQEGNGDTTTPDDPIAAEFTRAAAALREKLEEQNMCIEDKILKYLQKYCMQWGEDLDGRREDAKDSGPGRQATLQYQQTLAYFKPLYQQLQRKEVPPEMVAGLWMYIQDIQNRNYLHAYDIYMHLAIGNAPWPIGVTSIGIHDRSAREKISHTMNAAHIMNDEATRKYLQGIKRLLTFMQRAFPTDPSRSVDFDGFKDAGRGAAGSGSDKLALLQAEQSGTTADKLGLLPAPHHLDADGSVRVPEKWENMVKRSDAFKEKTAAKTPPRTPPRAAQKQA